MATDPGDDARRAGHLRVLGAEHRPVDVVRHRKRDAGRDQRDRAEPGERATPALGRLRGPRHEIRAREQEHADRDRRQAAPHRVRRLGRRPLAPQPRRREHGEPQHLRPLAQQDARRPPRRRPRASAPTASAPPCGRSGPRGRCRRRTRPCRPRAASPTVPGWCATRRRRPRAGSRSARARAKSARRATSCPSAPRRRAGCPPRGAAHRARTRSSVSRPCRCTPPWEASNARMRSAVAASTTPASSQRFSADDQPSLMRRTSSRRRRSGRSPGARTGACSGSRPARSCA